MLATDAKTTRQVVPSYGHEMNLSFIKIELASYSYVGLNIYYLFLNNSLIDISFA